MKQRIIIHLLLSAALLQTGAALAQAPDPNKAGQLKQQAISLMDDGHPDEALLLLDSACRLDPDNHTYEYEMGYAYYIKKDFSRAIEIFRKTTRYSDATDQCYQMLGNAYDMNNQRAAARDAYAEGLRHFPNAGRLYMESGITYLIEEKYDTAVALWEKGIEVEPTYSSNYYRLAKLFARTDERIWAVLYGELFMNIERNSQRTAEISKLLFDTYKKSIRFSDTSNGISLNMTSDKIIIGANTNPKTYRPPFRMDFTLVFLTGLTPMALTPGKRAVTISSLSSARITFLELWYNKMKFSKDYPNVLLDFEKTINEKGFLDEYNHWLLMKGDEDEFNDWYRINKEKFDAFAVWFADNPLHLDKDHLLVRTQYSQ